MESYYNSLDHYWMSNDYDNLFSPYDPNRDGGRDGEGYRKNGSVYQYKSGSVQNYTDDLGNKYATFTKSDGVLIKFPGVTITNTGIPNGTGLTTPNGGIHMDTSFGLVDLQHEYGHYLHAQIIGAAEYFAKVVPTSIYSAYRSTVYGTDHQSTWTEKIANNLASSYFGPDSDIAKSQFYKK